MLRAARYLGVAPWELLGRSRAWRELAIAAESAENWAEAEREKRLRRGHRGR